MTGFSEGTVQFLQDLRANNTRDWFHNNRQAYLASVKDAAQQFGDEMVGLLQTEFIEGFEYKVFRINRDLRFSKDKTPYHTDVHMSFWRSSGGALSPHWMMGLEPGKLTFGAGIMRFSKEQLLKWRTNVAGTEGETLTPILADLTEQKSRFPEAELKRIPAPFKKGHVRGDLLKRKSLTAWHDTSNTKLCFGKKGVQACSSELLRYQHVMTWLEENLGDLDA